MKAVICTRYGGPEVLSIQDVKLPVIKENQLLIKVMASSATTAESMMRQGTPKFARLFLGLRKPKAAITGTGFAGIVEAVGSKVKAFSIGDHVFGETALGAGTNAEYTVINDDGLVMIKPASIDFEEAATLCDGTLTAMNFLMAQVKLSQGQSVLINGASGSIGSAAIQISKLNKLHVTAICSSKNWELVKSLGADEVIAYDQIDFTKTSETYDAIFDTVGKSSFQKCKKLLATDGTYLSPVLSLSLLVQSVITPLVGRKAAKFCATGLLPAATLKPLLFKTMKWCESGLFKTVIEKTYPIKQISKAHRHIDTGHKVGNVVLSHADFN
ncbi:MAG: NAD(P)-dependent alcohol dehydrogenase [Carboxylicivirga sp.]|jgi:NADPH:quinone reductase-like Zn-dependent oxidoreductase|nr:NAD(P)-dependent alcohol dehydrogenase [Carboxylicivirga sp.]